MYCSNIQNTTVISYPKYKNLNYQNPVKKTDTHTQVNFTGSKLNFFIDLFNINPIYKLKNFTTEEYKMLKPYDLKMLREQYAELINLGDFQRYKSLERFHQDCASYIKNTLDDTFGEGKYVVIIVGRSLSSVGKVLGYKIGDENVKNIPMSEAYRYMYHRPDSSDSEIRKFVKFLKSIGLSKKKIEKSDKKHVLIDYCLTGDSLAGALKLLKSDAVFGNNKKIVSMDIINDYKQTSSARYGYYRLLSMEEYKDYAFVHCCSKPCPSKKYYVNSFIEPIRKRLIWFKLLDNEMRAENMVG